MLYQLSYAREAFTLAVSAWWLRAVLLTCYRLLYRLGSRSVPPRF